MTVAFGGATDRLVVGFAGVVSVGLLLTSGLLWRLWTSVGDSPAGEQSMDLLTGELNMFVVLLAAGIVISLFAGVFGTFLIRYVIVFGAVQNPIVVV